MISLGYSLTEITMHLFIDTSDFIQLGVLNEDLSFEVYEFREENRGATNIHLLLKQVLDKANTDINSIKDIFCISGPGSYTGMRVSEGIVQTLKWQGHKVYSLYAFEIPRILGIESGQWIANAYKGELFVYNWDSNSEDTKLVNQDSFSPSSNTFSAYANIDGIEALPTREMLIQNSAAVFSFAKSRGAYFDPHYYREAQQEFHPSV